MNDYANRGVFGSLDTGKEFGDTAQFTFTWHGNRPVRCVVTPPTLILRDYLPAVPARSDLYKDMRQLVQQFGDPLLPEHRGIAPSRAAVRVSNSRKRLSLVIESLDGDYGYATRKLIFVAHEVWLRLQSEWVYYLWDELKAPME